METTQYTKEVKVYRTVWTIPNFSRLMNLTSLSGEEREENILQLVDPGFYIKGKQQSIPFRGKRNQELVWHLTCLPSGSSVFDRSTVQLDFVVLKNIDGKVKVSFGLLDKNGDVEVVKKTVIDSKHQVAWATVPHGRFPAAPDRLMPGGCLVVHVELEIILDTFAVASLVTSPLQQEDLQHTMLDTFVDIGPSSVVLVFEDGELRCHTFPLAARNGT